MLIKYPCPNNNISCHPVPLLLTKGNWKIELWGAGTTNGGGYTSGILSLRKMMTLFAFMGGQEMPPGPQSGYGGYNGGGNSTKFGILEGYYRQSGGSGSTDIRIIENDINSRIIVAGGSGGGSCDMIKLPGGYGGGLIGGDGTFDPNYPRSGYGKGGTQKEGGKGYLSGSVFKGAATTPAIYSDCIGAGGGGYYGGGSGYDEYVSATGGGGSSYISGHNECEKHSSNIVFKRPVMIPGNELMPQPNATDKTGYIGQGAVRVTFLSSFNSCRTNHRNTLSLFIFILIISS